MIKPYSLVHLYLAAIQTASPVKNLVVKNLSLKNNNNKHMAIRTRAQFRGANKNKHPPIEL